MVEHEKLFVIDANVIIEGKSIEIPFSNMITIPEVTEEIRDSLSGIKFDTLDIIIKEPKEEYISKIRDKRDEVNVEVSETDLKLLSLAMEKDAVLVSDDYPLLDLADHLRVDYTSFLTEGISQQKSWVTICPGCGKSVHGSKCSRCGLEPVRVVSSDKTEEKQ